MPSGEPRRVYQFAVGDSAKNDTAEHSKDDNNMSFVDALQFTGSVHYTSDKSKTSSDDTTFEVYNLTPEMRKAFQVVGATIMLRAGYDDLWVRSPSGDVTPDYDQLPIIYVGSVLYASSRKRGVDIVTTIHCSNDKVERATTKTSTRYSPGTKVSAVINDLVKQMKIPVISIDTTPCDNMVYESGLSVYGRVADELTRICEENGLVWYTHNKQIRVDPVTSAPKNLAWEIHPFNVIDSVEAYYKQTQTKNKKPAASKHPRGHRKAHAPKAHADDVKVEKTAEGTLKTKQGVRLKVHLDGRIKLGDNVKLVDCGDDYDGTYKIISLQHSLDFRGGEWATELEMVAVGE